MPWVVPASQLLACRLCVLHCAQRPVKKPASLLLCVRNQCTCNHAQVACIVAAIKWAHSCARAGMLHAQVCWLRRQPAWALMIRSMLHGLCGQRVTKCLFLLVAVCVLQAAPWRGVRKQELIRVACSFDWAALAHNTPACDTVAKLNKQRGPQPPQRYNPQFELRLQNST